eukprot:13548388-Alexandrium_andersonii.AAC.1
MPGEQGERRPARARGASRARSREPHLPVCRQHSSSAAARHAALVVATMSSGIHGEGGSGRA